ncbi:MAG TPA: bestrophin family ion channel [Kouleothrix sp.]|uniref:bestrophin family protein n=1 Tax=Kouleothrix sp. TaxID=2779161 RepID=UPI002C379B2E|nr:bestrophin family ion channel [Kouleothrix sp.]HRC75566.1 bestrophin family ion channel [Kouleothrix sp.]
MIIKRNFDPRKVATYVWKDVTLALAVAVAVYAAVALLGWSFVALSFAPIGLLGAALSIFLAFRANTSFARWGEAAQAWAAITAASRVFGRLVVTFTDSHRHTPQYKEELAEAFKRELVYRQIAWANALRLELRGQASWREIEQFLPPADSAALRQQPNKPLYLMKRQGQRIYDGMASGTLQGFDSFQMEGQLAVLAAQQAVCERIKAIPIPRQYDYFTRVFVRVFVVLLPFFLAKTLVADGVPWLVVPLSGVIAFLFTVIERTGAVNEDPFENHITDVPLSAACREIERDLRAMLGEADLPPSLEAQDGYLF